MKVFYEADADRSALEGKQIAVLGYGSQGHAHALNLRDSGFSVHVGLRPSSARVSQAEEAGLKVYEPGEAVAKADVIMVLLPDELQPGV